jgi:hypothetical protein
MVIIFGECGRNAGEAARVFSERFSNRNHPDHMVILRAMAMTQQTGQVLLNRKEHGGPPMMALFYMLLKKHWRMCRKPHNMSETSIADRWRYWR